MKYLRLIPALLLGAMLTACNTTKKLYETQEYDQVIQRVAPDICAGDMNTNRINMVAASYHKANQSDHERIQTLKATGQPDVWPEIYQRYCSMKGRNDALSCFPTKVKNGMNYVKLDLDDDMNVARNKAESFLVAKINQLLATGTKENGQEAIKYVAQLARTNKDNPNIPKLVMRSSLCMGDAVSSVLTIQAISLCQRNLRRQCLLLMRVNSQPIILFLPNGIESFLSCIQLMLWWMR